jgi:hypothetical protein
MSWPFQSNATETFGEDVRLVAKYQRWVILSLLISVILGGFFLAIAFEIVTLPQNLLIAVQFVAEPLYTFMSISAFLLARQFYTDVRSIVLAMLMTLPFISLIVLLLINQKATSFLVGHGVQVGILGANTN